MIRRWLLPVLLISSSLLFSQSNPIVQVDPVANLSGEAWLDTVCVTATDGVSLTLSLLGQFQVSTDDLVQSDLDLLDTSILKSRAEAEGYDNILFGSCTIEDGSYVITMNAYDLAMNEITYSGSTIVESIFDTFEAIDQITYQTVEGFSGIHVTYGSLVLIPPETGEPFSFTIDGVALQDGLFSIDKMPSGIHELAVSQERPLGFYEAVHEINVDKETDNNIIIPLPQIAGEEVPIFNKVDHELRLAALDGRMNIGPVSDELKSLLTTSFFQDFRPEIIKKYERWSAVLGGEIQIVNEPGKFNTKFVKRSLWDSSSFKGVFNNGICLSSQFRILLLNEDQLILESRYVPEKKTITVDGKADDWTDVSTVFQDNIDDLDFMGFIDSSDEHGDGQDIEWVGVAMDEKNLYFAMETLSGNYRNDRFYIMEVYTGDLVNLRYDGKEKNIYGQVIYGNNWDNYNNKWFDTEGTFLKGIKGEIIEFSIPINQIEKWVQPNGGQANINFFVQRSSEPYKNIDSYTIYSILPSIYYALRAETP